MYWFICWLFFCTTIEFSSISGTVAAKHCLLTNSSRGSIRLLGLLVRGTSIESKFQYQPSVGWYNQHYLGLIMCPAPPPSPPTITEVMLHPLFHHPGTTFCKMKVSWDTRLSSVDVRGSYVFCLIVTIIALFIDISAVFCNIVLVCQSDLWQIPWNYTTAEEACCHVGNSCDRTFLGSSFPCAGEDFLETTIVVINCKTKWQRKRLKYRVCWHLNGTGRHIFSLFFMEILFLLRKVNFMYGSVYLLIFHWDFMLT